MSLIKPSIAHPIFRRTGCKSVRGLPKPGQCARQAMLYMLERRSTIAQKPRDVGLVRLTHRSNWRCRPPWSSCYLHLPSVSYANRYRQRLRQKGDVSWTRDEPVLARVPVVGAPALLWMNCGEHDGLYQKNRDAT